MENQGVKIDEESFSAKEGEGGREVGGEKSTCKN